MQYSSLIGLFIPGDWKTTLIGYRLNHDIDNRK